MTAISFTPIRRPFFFKTSVPEEQLAPVLKAHGIDYQNWTEYFSPYPTLFVDTGEHKVLIDTGAGQIAPTTGQLLPNLRAVGIAPEAIDTVILSHVHPDHAGGILDKEGKLAFPNAQFVLWRKEWDFWRNDPDLSGFKVPQLVQHLIDCANKGLPAIKDRVRLIDREEEIVPGIKALFTPGHTPGHMALIISSNGETLLYLADTALHPIHLEHPDWVSAVDLHPEDTVASRLKAIDRAVADRALVLAHHFPYPGLGRIVKQGRGGKWQPVEQWQDLEAV